MSEQVKPGDRFRHKLTSYRGLVVEAKKPKHDSVSDWDCVVIESGVTTIPPGSHWVGTLGLSQYYDRLPPADTGTQSPEGPRVGEVWRFSGCGNFELLRQVENAIPSSWMCKNFHTGGEHIMHNVGLNKCWSRVSPAPQPAAPMVEPPEPECPECHDPGETVKLRRVWLYQDPHDMCDGCYMDMERTAEMETAKEARPIEAPLPRDRWRPFIASLGAVRPFGSPRGAR